MLINDGSNRKEQPRSVLHPIIAALGFVLLAIIGIPLLLFIPLFILFWPVNYFNHPTGIQGVKSADVSGAWRIENPQYISSIPPLCASAWLLRLYPDGTYRSFWGPQGCQANMPACYTKGTWTLHEDRGHTELLLSDAYDQYMIPPFGVQVTKEGGHFVLACADGDPDSGYFTLKLIPPRDWLASGGDALVIDPESP